VIRSLCLARIVSVRVPTYSGFARTHFRPRTTSFPRRYLFRSAAVAVDSSHVTASSSASRSRFRPPSNVVNGHVSTMWFIVSRWPQSQEGDWARPHLCKLARHGRALTSSSVHSRLPHQCNGITENIMPLPTRPLCCFRHYRP